MEVGPGGLLRLLNSCWRESFPGASWKTQHLPGSSAVFVPNLSRFHFISTLVLFMSLCQVHNTTFYGCYFIYTLLLTLWGVGIVLLLRLINEKSTSHVKCFFKSCWTQDLLALTICCPWFIMGPASRPCLLSVTALGFNHWLSTFLGTKKPFWGSERACAVRLGVWSSSQCCIRAILLVSILHSLTPGLNVASSAPLGIQIEKISCISQLHPGLQAGRLSAAVKFATKRPER